MAVDNNVLESFIGAIKQETPTRNTTYQATVARTDDEGVVWVYVAGSESETPTASSSAEVKMGDVVTVEWRNNKLYILGNYSNPSAGVTRVARVEQDASRANMAAQVATEYATQAQAAAESAQTSAESAQTSAVQALASATAAQTSATNAYNQAVSATNSANSALTQLGIVEDVVGTLNWISEHGTYKASTDTAVVAGKYYFTRTGSGTTADPYVYTVVANPTGNPSTNGYYELDSVDEAVSNYVKTHLALTDDGLYVTFDNSGYKLKLTNVGAYIINSSGTVVATYSTETIIGAVTARNVYIDSDSVDIRNGTNVLASFGAETTIGNIDNHDSYALIASKSFEYYSPALSMMDGTFAENVRYFYLTDISGEETTAQFLATHQQDTFVVRNLDVSKPVKATVDGTEVTISDYYNDGSTLPGNPSSAFVILETPVNTGANVIIYYTARNNVIFPSMTFGSRTSGYGLYSASIGVGNSAAADYSYAEGRLNQVFGGTSHAEGYHNIIVNCEYAHAEGYENQCSGNYAHVEGYNSKAMGACSHAEGYNSRAYGQTAGGAHAQNIGTLAYTAGQTTMGTYNVDDYIDTSNPTHPSGDPQYGHYALIIGNGTADDARSNAFAVDWNGAVTAGALDDDGGLNDEALLSSSTITLWKSILGIS